MFDLKQKPKLILAKLRDKGIIVKNKAQVSNYIKTLKQKKYGRTTISLGEFEQWCQDRTVIPDDEDKGFIAAYFVYYDNDDDEIDDEEDVNDNEKDGKKYRAFFTTKRLIKLAALSNKITYMPMQHIN